jgi:predicted acylesterase/phospholipase RssA
VFKDSINHVQKNATGRRTIKPRVGLVLSGGSARGMAHLGVISVLEEYGIPINTIVAASFGSIVGAYYALGYDVPTLIQMMKQFRLRSVLDLKKPFLRIMSREKIEAIFKKDFGDKRLEELKIPLYILAGDITENRPILFERGRLIDAVQASISCPGLFEPYEINGHSFIDGGILNRLLVQLAKEKEVDVTIFSDVRMFNLLNRNEFAKKFYMALMRHVEKKRWELEKKLKRKNLRYIIFKALCLIQDSEEQLRRASHFSADFTIVPNLMDIKPLAFSKVEEAFRLGREAALRSIEKIAEKVHSSIRAGTTR